MRLIKKGAVVIYKITKLTVYYILLVLASRLISSATVVHAGPIVVDDIYQEAQNFDGTVGIYAKNLNTGQMINYQSDLVFPTASTSKLVVAIAVYKYMYPYASEEAKKRYDECVKAMIEVSDNNAFYELLDEIDRSCPDALNQVTRDMKLKQTRIHDEDTYQVYSYHSVTTAQEMAEVMENLVNMNYLDPQKTELLKDELADTIFDNEMPRYIQTKVMHKVGELDQVLCDVGVIDDGVNQIVISIYTVSTNDEDYASDFIATISYKVYKALNGSENFVI